MGNGAGPSRHFASQRKRRMRPRRSLHAFGSQEIGQLREEHLPCLGGVGRRTHDLCCERKSRHREVLRPTSVWPPPSYGRGVRFSCGWPMWSEGSRWGQETAGAALFKPDLACTRSYPMSSCGLPIRLRRPVGGVGEFTSRYPSCRFARFKASQ